VFGVITNKIAHVALFAATSVTADGDSCEDSGELQFK
jgi:hypothetical protein